MSVLEPVHDITILLTKTLRNQQTNQPTKPWGGGGGGGKLFSLNLAPQTHIFPFSRHQFLPSPGDFEAEHQLFLRIYSAGVHLVSGGTLFHSRPGWFRMVAAMDEETHAEGERGLVVSSDCISDCLCPPLKIVAEDEP